MTRRVRQKEKTMSVIQTFTMSIQNEAHLLYRYTDKYR